MGVLHRQKELIALPLNDLEPSIDVEKHVVHTCFISKHTFNAHINSPSPFNFLYSRFKSTIFFPTNLQPGKRGALWEPWLFRPRPTIQ